MAESEDDEDPLLPVVRQLDLMVLLVFSFISSVRLIGPYLFFVQLQDLSNRDEPVEEIMVRQHRPLTYCGNFFCQMIICHKYFFLVNYV